MVKLARTEAVRPVAPRRPTLHRVARERPGMTDAFIELVAAAWSKYWLIACASFTFSPAPCRPFAL